MVLKIKDTGIAPPKIDDYKIQLIFQGFYNYNKIDNFDRITKLEIYFSPILENKTYFLSKQASKSPEVVAELVEIIYKEDNSIEYGAKINELLKKEAKVDASENS